CSPHRGMSVYKDTLLNVSRPQPLSGTTATTAAAQSRSNVPERIPGKPLLNPKERERYANPEAAAQNTRPAPVNPKGLVSTDIETSRGSNPTATTRSAWTEGNSQGHNTIKAQPGKIVKKASATDLKQQNAQILKGHTQQHQKQATQGHTNGKRSPSPKRTSTPNEMDKMTRDLKSMLSIGGSSQTTPPAPPQQQAPQSQEISHQILSMMGTGSAPVQYSSPYTVAANSNGYNNAPRQTELEQLVGGVRPQYYPNQQYGGAYNPNYQMNYYPPPGAFIPPGAYPGAPIPQGGFMPPMAYQPVPGGYVQPPPQGEAFRPPNGGGGYYNPSHGHNNHHGNNSRGNSRGGRGGRGGRGRGGRGGSNQHDQHKPSNNNPTPADGSASQ
ncbi:hypothetical protein HDU99_007879, partial [Rhizoclosmatium hyalinum]